ncbi:hypothetical protein GCM10009828_101110 [Actinoplanes couchii]|uniref:Uncharacterized protein n=1 Tax=Actinoplanes couchii TaxID=403638 RepID=A0ABQ3XLS9_9ACTN|nr:hypothetical protein Aco03nite_078780 [Actinoplanes couchii]
MPDSGIQRQTQQKRVTETFSPTELVRQRNRPEAGRVSVQSRLPSLLPSAAQLSCETASSSQPRVNLTGSSRPTEFVGAPLSRGDVPSRDHRSPRLAGAATPQPRSVPNRTM